MQAPREIVQLAYQAILIGLISFIFPIWISSGINLGAVLLKIFHCFSEDLPFWEDKELLIVLTVLSLFPIYYIFWFYYLTLQRIWRKLYESVLLNWNREIANNLSSQLINWYDKYDQQKKGDAAMVNTGEIMDQLLRWINEKVENWPRVISWATKKLLKKIPFLDLIMEYHQGEMAYGDHPQLVDKISKRLNTLIAGAIEEMVPKWTYFVIPVNLILLFILWSWS